MISKFQAKERSVVCFLVFALGLMLASCDDEGTTSSGNPDPVESSSASDSGETGGVCGFKKSDNVWKFSYSTWNFSEEYTWVDESTVEFKEYINAYHMDEDDTTYTNVNRDEFFDRIMERCLDLNDLLDESSSSSVDNAPEPAEGSSSDKAADVSSSSIASSSSEVLMTSSSSEFDISSSSEFDNNDEQSSSSLIVLVPPCKTDSTDDCEYGSLTDERDGQTYKTVKIGDQWWMAENLNYAFVLPTKDLDSSSFCLNDLLENCDKYGRLYIWSASMDSTAIYSNDGEGCGFLKKCSPKYPVRGICPSGWHIPDTTEWHDLFYMIGGEVIAKKMLGSSEGWNDSENGLDGYGFAAYPIGYRSYLGDYTHGMDHNGAMFATSTLGDWYAVYGFYIGYYREGAEMTLSDERDAVSVRCLKN